MPDSDTSSTAVPAAGQQVRILLPLPLDQAYDYLADADFGLVPGDYVRVPLGPRLIVGVVWDRDDGVDEAIAPQKLKHVDGRYDAPSMAPEMRRLIEWIAAYTVTPLGAVLRMAVGPSAILQGEGERIVYALPEHPLAEARLTRARERVLAVLSDGVPLAATALAREAGCSPAVVRGMALAGLIEPQLQTRRPPRPIPDWRRPFPSFSPAQDAAADAITEAVKTGTFEIFLLDGVTGSGKTEVYLRAVAAALEAGRQALVLLPEIALGTQWHARFEQQFGCSAAAWHSDVRSGERHNVWRDVAEGKARVVVGARSAMFLPFTDLGLIVIDEEHDASYKQEDGVIYHARDMAIVRASLHQIPVVLASATPSLESLNNVERGRYRRLVLPARHGAARMPEIELVDLRVSRPVGRQSFLSPALLKAMDETLAAEEQTMLFLNRRGYAPLTLCRRCGHRLQCPNCTAWLVEHRLLGRLMCHHCGHVAKPLQRCPECDAEASFAACGPGVERVAEELLRYFPEARIGLMVSDALAGPHALHDIVRQVETHALDILVGTQIMAKGHHFPLLTLVGVVDADLGLAGGDMRAAERTFQLLHQVSGRAGRADRPGRVLLQTFDPDHPVMQALQHGTRDEFLATEAEARARHGLPPFGRLAALIVSGTDESLTDEASAAIARAAPHVRGVAILGPAPAPLAILRARHRRRFLLKAERQVNVQAVVRAWLSAVRLPSSVRIQVDIDPYSFM
jgi:primosomal protein N' (replication factor Y)